MTEFENIVAEILSRYQDLDAKSDLHKENPERALLSFDLSSVFRKFTRPVYFILISANALEKLKKARPKEIRRELLRGLGRKEREGLTPIVISGPGSIL